MPIMSLKNRDYTHLPTSFERFRRELNRKKSKFERYGLISTLDFRLASATPELNHRYSEPRRDNLSPISSKKEDILSEECHCRASSRLRCRLDLCTATQSGVGHGSC
jgi:hypothetical protein